MAQRFSIHLTVQHTLARTLVQKDPTSLSSLQPTANTTESVPESLGAQLLRPVSPRARAHKGHRNEEPACHSKGPSPSLQLERSPHSKEERRSHKETRSFETEKVKLS